MTLNDGLWLGGVGLKASISAVCFGVKSMTADSSNSGVEGRVGRNTFLAASSTSKSANSKLVRRLVSVVIDIVVVKETG
jgi:hypothetical protein